MKKVTPPRRSLLMILVGNHSTLSGRQLSIPERVLASRMQADGLVIWEPPFMLLKGKNLDEWRLHITAAGRAALQSP